MVKGEGDEAYMANSDGNIVLTVKTQIDSTLSATIDKLKQKFNSLSASKGGKSINKEFADTKNIVEQLTATISEQQTILQELRTEYAGLIVEGKEGTPPGQELKEAITTAEKELAVFSNTLDGMADKGKEGTKKLADGFKNVRKRIAQIAKQLFLFQLIYKLFNTIKQIFSDVLMSNAEFREDWEELKAAFYTAVYPIIELLVPALQIIINAVKQWLVAIGNVAAAIKGITYNELVEQSKATKQMADNFEKSEKSSEGIKRNLAGFDEVTVLQDENKGDSDTSGFDNLQDFDSAQTQTMLANITQSIGGALTAVGIILLFHGIVSWGIGFIIAGATLWAITEIATSEYSTDPIINTVAQVSGYIATALAAIGVILLCCGLVPWGLGFIAAGAVIFGVHELAANWDELPKQTQDTISNIMAIVGAGMLILGILLCCTGVGIALGIALIAAGAISLVTVVALNWNAIVDKVKEIIDNVLEWIKTYGLLVIAILLCLTIVGIPFGIALIIKWAKDNADKVELAQVILEKVKSAWESIKQFWNKHIAKIFTFAFWLDLIKKAANGVISGVEALINGIISGFENMLNWVVDGINSIGFDVPDWLQWMLGEHFGFNIPHVHFGRAKLPRLAQGAVIPANREFLAVLGDQKRGVNIETPLATMLDAFNTALDERGGNGDSQVPIHVHLYLDGREVYNSVVNQNRENTRVTGINALAY